jgi:hypothetical protein
MESMIKPKVWLPVAISLVLIIFCMVLLPSARRILPSFPEILLGQVALARETKPPLAQAYQSAEFVLNQVAVSEIEQAFYIPLNDDVLFWDSWYVGFPRTKLNQDEIRALQHLFSAGRLFSQVSDGASSQCVNKGPSREPRLETCVEGEHYMDQYVAYQWNAEQNHTVGVLQIYLTGGRMAEIRVYPSEYGIAYTPNEMSGDWWLNGLTDPSPLLEELSTRATLQPISVLWPELTTDQANALAARILGNRYQLALEIIQDSSTVREVFGPIQEIRPATGKNISSSWMDSSSVFLSFRVIGARGEGAIIMQGDDCFDLQMVFQGIPKVGGNSDSCYGGRSDALPKTNK